MMCHVSIPAWSDPVFVSHLIRGPLGTGDLIIWAKDDVRQTWRSWALWLNKWFPLVGATGGPHTITKSIENFMKRWVFFLKIIVNNFFLQMVSIKNRLKIEINSTHNTKYNIFYLVKLRFNCTFNLISTLQLYNIITYTFNLNYDCVI